MAMDQYEISNRHGLTLAQALEAEEIPKPELMRFQGWLAWRGTEGLRTSGAFEADLRRNTLDHGDGLRQQLEGGAGG